MLRYTKAILAILALSIPLVPLAEAQGFDRNFVLLQTKSMSSDEVVLTLKQPSSGARLVELKAAVLQCASATSFTVEINCGTPATTTAQTPTPVGYPRTVPNVEGYVNSNAASCTVIGSMGVSAGFPAAIDLNGIWLAAAGNDITLRSATVTSGSCTGWFVGKEF